MRRFSPRRRSEESLESGQDSFLDIVSNIVGILIILVMIAGARVGAVNPAADPIAPVSDSAAVSVPVQGPDPKENRQEYIEICRKFESGKEAIQSLKGTVGELNTQLQRVKMQADNVENQHHQMLVDIDGMETIVQMESEKKDKSTQQQFEQKRAVYQLDEKIKELQRIEKSLEESGKKSIKIENIPTPLGKKVEGHEGFFCLRNGRISHVPMNVFSERLRSYFRNFRQIQQSEIDDAMGPIEGYTFHFQASLTQVREADGTRLSFSFNFGECIPENDLLGETLKEALADGSVFRRKVALYLKESSTITLFVYPDSFNELREIKKILLEKEYNIALRPMPQNQRITFSPHGSKSTTY
ncbi:MAG: hypothetical protein Q4G69_04410 [Planctomycetia bacterium]|nr:hypothetical protein [Planctomycetia bacterium]